MVTYSIVMDSISRNWIDSQGLNVIGYEQYTYILIIIYLYINSYIFSIIIRLIYLN
jgi:hypothetical protein